MKENEFDPDELCNKDYYYFDLDKFSIFNEDVYKELIESPEEHIKAIKLAFSLIGDNDSLLDLVAPDERTHNYWVDGLNNLLMKPMVSDDFRKEKNILLNMEIKLRLLDLEGVDLPKEAPPIPPPPADFNFASR